MKIGDAVTYVSPYDTRYHATVTAVVGSGASGWKILALTYARGTAEAVAHCGDHAHGAGYWEQRAADQDAAIEEAFLAGTLPGKDRRADDSYNDEDDT